MLVAKDSPLRSARDLDGKTIGVSGLNDIFSLGVRAWADQHGGDLVELAVIAVQDVIDPRLHHPRGQRGRAGHDQGRDHRQGDLRLVPGEVGPRDPQGDLRGFQGLGQGLGVRHDTAPNRRVRDVAGANCIFNSYHPTSMWGQLTRIPKGLQLN